MSLVRLRVEIIIYLVQLMVPSVKKTLLMFFYEKYNPLYNSVPYDKDEMNDIKCGIEDDLFKRGHNDYVISVADVIKSLAHLKQFKTDGEEGLMSDNIIHGTHSLYVLLTIVFNAMLIYGVSPDSMILGTMVPIPKNKKKSLCNSDNYRAIALSSIIGFKNNLSTTQCTFCMMETVNYYNFNRSNVYVLLLDASKAFDRVKYCKLFRELSNRQMSPLVKRLLMYMYTDQRLQVRWGDEMCSQFGVVNGVKQGGVLSPLLFAVYIDGLLIRLEETSVGCHMGIRFIGALAFADDLNLLAPTLSGLKILIDVCEKYAKEFNIKFNGSKSRLLLFKGRNCKISTRGVTVNSVSLTVSETAVHIGHHMSTKDKECTVNAGKNSFWRSFNLFISDYDHIYSFLKK